MTLMRITVERQLGWGPSCGGLLMRKDPAFEEKQGDTATLFDRCVLNDS